MGVLAGGFFVWLALFYIRPRVQQGALKQRREDLRNCLQGDSVAVPPGLFLSYVRAGAVELNEDLGNGALLASLVETHQPGTVRTLLAAGASAEAHGPGQYRGSFSKRT